MSTQKPPLGVMPRWLWLENRAADLSRAILEYTNTLPSQRNQELIANWGQEIAKITSEIEIEHAERARD